MEVHNFKRRLDDLRNIIADGIAYFSAWRGLAVGDEISAQALNRYRGLFLPAQMALKKMALMEFAKVFDRDPRTPSLRNLLSAAKENREKLTPYATEENLLDIEQKIDASKGLLRRLKRYRDQRLAHHDAIIAGDTRLPYGEVRELVEEVKSMYDSLRVGHDGEGSSFEYLARNAETDTTEVVRIMREERDRGDQMVREAMQRLTEADTG